MALPKRFSRKTKGFNAQVIVAKAINYTADATLAAFAVSTNTLGEVGVYDANDALHTDAITALEFFKFVIKTTQGLKTTPLYKLSEVVAITKQAYVAPVKQVSSIGWNGTGGSIVNPTLAKGQVYSLGVLETTEGNEPLPNWDYNYVAITSAVAIDIMRDLARQINDTKSIVHKANNPLVKAKVKADATYGNYAFTGTTPVLQMTNGSIYAQIESGANDGVADIAVGDLISFDAAAAPTDAIGDIYKVVAKAAGNDALVTLDRAYQGATQIFTEAEAEGTRVKKVTAVVEVGLELTALDFGTNFRLVVRENLEDALITYTTPYNPGTGTWEQVYWMEREGQTFAGDTAKNAPFGDRFGQQDTFAVEGETYDILTFEINKAERGVGVQNTRTLRSYVQIILAKSAGNVDSTMDTLFAL